MALDLDFKPFSGVGIVSMYPLNTAGVPLGGFDLGEAPGFKIGQSSPTSEMKTSRDVSRGVAYRMTQSKGASLDITLKTLSDFTLGLITSGSWSSSPAGSAVVGWAAPGALVAKQLIRLPDRNVSAVTVRDSTAGTAKTLPVGQYELDAVAGTVRLLDIATGGPYVQPFKVDYTPGAVKVLAGLKAPDTDYLVLLNGTNAYNGDRGVLEGFKFRFAADGDADWIGEDYGTWTLKGSLQLDSTRPASGPGGQYYSFTKAEA